MNFYNDCRHSIQHSPDFRWRNTRNGHAGADSNQQVSWKETLSISSPFNRRPIGLNPQAAAPDIPSQRKSPEARSQSIDPEDGASPLHISEMRETQLTPGGR